MKAAAEAQNSSPLQCTAPGQAPKLAVTPPCPENSLRVRRRVKKNCDDQHPRPPQRRLHLAANTSLQSIVVDSHRRQACPEKNWYNGCGDNYYCHFAGYGTIASEHLNRQHEIRVILPFISCCLLSRILAAVGFYHQFQTWNLNFGQIPHSPYTPLQTTLS